MASVVARRRARSQSDNHYVIIIQHLWTSQRFAIFLAVAEERSFSRAAAKVHRTQPAVSQAVRRLEADLGEQLFDRSSKSGTLTDAGRVLQNYGQRLVRLAEEAESAMRELRDLRRGRVLIGANEAAVHTLLPLMARFRQRVPDIADRRPPRAGAADRRRGAAGQPRFRRADVPPAGSRPARSRRSAATSSCCSCRPSHPLAKRRQVTMEDVAGEPVVAHNDPSPARERVLRLFEEQHIALNMVIALPSLDGIKRAVELKLGVALLPRRCAITEIASGRLVAVPVAGISRKRQVTLVCRKAHRSHAANAFLEIAQEGK